MRSQAKSVCWKAASWTFLGLVGFGFAVTLVAGV